MKRIYGYFGVGLALTVIAWLGLSAYVGAQADQQLQNILAASTSPSASSALRIENKDFFSSSYIQDIDIDTRPWAAILPLPSKVHIRLRYELRHGPLLSTDAGMRFGLAEIKTQLVTEATDWNALSSVVGQHDVLDLARATTSVDFDGTIRSLVYVPEGLSLVLPALDKGRMDEGLSSQVRLGKLNGWVVSDAAVRSIWFDVFMDRMVTQAGFMRSESQGVRWFGFHEREKGPLPTGYLVAHVTRVESKSEKPDSKDLSFVALDDDSVLSFRAEQAGYSASAQRSVSRLDISNVSLAEVKVRMALRELDPEMLLRLGTAILPALEKVIAAPNDRKVFEQASASMLEVGAPILAAKPPRLDIDELSALNPGGLFAASASVRMQALPHELPGPAGMLAALRVEAKATMPRRFMNYLGELNALSPLLDQVVASGYAIDDRGVLTSDMKFDGHRFMINNRTLP